jgi:hypothetical protein
VNRALPLTLAVVLLSACAQPTSDPAPAAAPTTAVEGVPAADWAGDDEGTPDCDREDWAARETPDCGWLDGGRFVAWTWAPKRTTPPPGLAAGPGAARDRPDHAGAAQDDGAAYDQRRSA